MCGEITSTLYTYEGFKKKNLYQVVLDNCESENSNEGSNTVTKLILKKALPFKHDDPTRLNTDSLVEIQNIKLPKPIEVAYDTSYFDYGKFWKVRYKKLLKYQ